YAWSGQRSAALQQYRECVRVLDRELGVAPLTRTSALNDAIRAGRLPPPGPPALTAPSGAAGPRAEPAPGAAGSLPLVGRGAELALLEVALADLGGGGRLVTVEGEAGIGKTRLITALEANINRVGPAGRRAVVTRSHEGEEALAFGVLADLLRAAARAGGADAQTLPEAWTEEVGRLLPELRGTGRAGPDPAPLDSPGAQSRFYAALVSTLARLLGPGALLAVEDLQWADESSVEVLAYLLRRLSDFPVLVVLSWRGDFLPLPSLRGALAESRRDNLATTLELGPLSEGAVGELAAALLPPELAIPEVIARLFTETDGVPLFVTEYLDVFRREGRVPAEADWQLPGGVRDLLLGRLSGLSETTDQVLAAAAVLGGDIDLTMLRLASGRGEDEVVTAVEEAGRRAVLVEVADSGSYGFAHDGLRRLVLELTGLARRRLLHGRAADALMQRRDAYLLSASIAGHLRLAGREADSAEWSWRAAERARALYAHTEALEHLAAATALGYPGPGGPQMTGDVLTVLGRYPEALAAYERAAATWPPDDRPALAAVEHKLAEVHHRLGDWDVAASHLGGALELLRDGADPVAQARVLADLALVADRRRDAATAARTAGQALQLARATGDDAALAQTLDVLGVLAAQQGDHAAAVAHLEASLGHAARLADPGARVAALNNLALVHAAAGRPDDAVAVGREALQRGLEHGDRHRVAALHTNLADLLHAAGQGHEALEHLKEAARLFAGIDSEQARRPEIWKLAQW
ncbi:MAG: AAA family ATPase, partial [Pseudonocardiales bacterium]